MLYLLNTDFADTLTGMTAMVSPPLQMLGSNTCNRTRSW